MSDERDISVLLVEPGKAPKLITIKDELEAYQEMVGGYIEVLYPFEDEVGIICNEEGKLVGLPPNRAMFNEDGKAYDIIAGKFLVVGLGEENFDSLSPKLAEKYRNKFRYPERFVMAGDEIKVIHIKPKGLSK